MQDRIDQGYNSIFGMKTGDITDQQRATLANLNTQTGVKNNLIGGNATSSRFSNFEPRIGLQTQPNTTSFYENEMSIPTQPQGLSTSFNIGDSFLNNNPEVRGMLGINNNLGSTEPASTFDNANFINSDIAPEFQDMAVNIGLTEKQKGLLDARKGMLGALGADGILSTIQTEDDPKDPATLNDVKEYYGLPI